MARPAVAPSTEDLYDALAPLAADDEALGWPLLVYGDVLCRVFVEPVAQYVAERDGRAPWELMLDPANAPAAGLPYLAQYVGLEVTPDMSEADLRAGIQSPTSWNRGQVPATIEDMQATLTGAPPTVLVDERYLGDAWQTRIRTFASETPNPAATEARIRRRQKPVGIVLTYEAITGQDWGDLVADHADWTATLADYDTWTEARSDLP